MTRLTVVQVEEPLDINGFREAIAQACAATTATPTTSVTVEDSTVRTSTKEKELDLDNSTIEQQQENNDLTQEESMICTPPWKNVMTVDQEMDANAEAATEHATALAMLPLPGTPQHHPLNPSIDEDDLILSTDTPEKTSFQKAYERFQKERRDKMRKEREESSIDRLERKGKNTLYTGYNQ